MHRFARCALPLASFAALAACAPSPSASASPDIGRVEVETIPFPSGLELRSGTYTPSGRVLVSYDDGTSTGPRDIRLATMADDGSDLRPFFAADIPVRPKDNALRFMVFPDNRRILLGDFVIECARSLDDCPDPNLVPVIYPREVSEGEHLAHRWSEIIVAPDNRHIAWTTLFTGFSALAFTGELKREADAYVVVDTRIVGTLDPFRPDPDHADGVLPNLVRGGEVKQFVKGGKAISLVGAGRYDLPDSVVQHLDTTALDIITQTPGYTETTIFSPDERLGITMSAQFSEESDLAILGLMPRPYPGALSIDVSMVAYIYSVLGVRRAREGSIGPVLIDVAASRADPDYRGIDLHREPDWVYHSPMSWHPDGRSAMWVEGRRPHAPLRLRAVRLPDREVGPGVPTAITPHDIPYACADLSLVEPFAHQARQADVRVYGRHSGHIDYRRAADGTTTKSYEQFSDDGRSIFSGSERMVANPAGRSVYTADITLSGERHGRMDLTMVFGPLGGPLPAQIIFEADDAGRPASHGYAEYEGRRLEVADLRP